jgi:hypothetical protein
MKEPEIYTYKNYKEYIRHQIKANREKLERVWAQKENIKFLSQVIKSYVEQPDFGICHGTRRGKEQEWFRENLHCEVIGTEIAPTAKRFPYTIRWDFHKVHKDWIGKCDFIYSNSWDHAYDPEKAITGWCRCLSKDGILILEHTKRHLAEVDKTDPFRASIWTLKEFIKEWTNNEFHVINILEMPTRKFGAKALIIKRKEMKIDTKRKKLMELASKVPELGGGGKKIGDTLLTAAKNVENGQAIIEIGSYLGSATAFLCAGVKYSERDVEIHCYDKWQADETYKERAKKHNNLNFYLGQDLRPFFLENIDPIKIPVDTYKEDFGKVKKWESKRKIGLLVHDAGCELSIMQNILKLFRRSFIKDKTLLILMDYYFYERKKEPEFKIQKAFMEKHKDTFMFIRKIKNSRAAIFMYTGNDREITRKRSKSNSLYGG